jgi:hypothetical protein
MVRFIYFDPLRAGIIPEIVSSQTPEGHNNVWRQLTSKAQQQD